MCELIFILQIEHKWYFWLIIGIIASFLIVVISFALRGYKRWQRNKKKWADVAAETENSSDIENGTREDSFEEQEINASKKEKLGQEECERNGNFHEKMDKSTDVSTTESGVNEANPRDKCCNGFSNLDVGELQRRVGKKGHHR